MNCIGKVKHLKIILFLREFAERSKEKIEMKKVVMKKR